MTQIIPIVILAAFFVIVTIIGVFFQEQINAKLVVVNQPSRFGFYNIHHPVSFGRMGNRMYEFIMYRMMASHHCLPLSHEHYNFPRPFDQMDVNKTCLKWDLEPFNENIQVYPFHFKFYRNKRDRLISYLNITQTKRARCDVLIHLRLDDVFNDHGGYTLLPLSFYKAAFTRIGQVNTTCFVGSALEPLHKRHVYDLRHFTRQYSKTTQWFGTQSIEKDFRVLMSAHIVIGSSSSFWFWPVYLSMHTKEIHVPIYDQTRAMGLAEPNMSDDFVKVFAYPLPFKDKIKPNTYNKLFYDI